jgi:hypothetical protein
VIFRATRDTKGCEGEFPISKEKARFDRYGWKGGQKGNKGRGDNKPLKRKSKNANVRGYWIDRIVWARAQKPAIEMFKLAKITEGQRCGCVCFSLWLVYVSYLWLVNHFTLHVVEVGPKLTCNEAMTVRMAHQKSLVMFYRKWWWHMWIVVGHQSRTKRKGSAMTPNSVSFVAGYKVAARREWVVGDRRRGRSRERGRITPRASLPFHLSSHPCLHMKK